MSAQPPPIVKPKTLAPKEPGLDAAQQSLSDALGVSFSVLKVLMVMLVVVYLFSGIFQVTEQNKALRLRFGQRVGEIYEPGWHIGLPFPLEEVIQIPSNVQRVQIDSAFWYDNPDNLPPERLANQPLDPLKDGFLITSDTSVVHIQFEVGYIIDKPDLFVKHVGDIERAEEIVRMAAERGMVHAVSSTSASDIVFQRNRKNFSDNVQAFTQDVLSDLNTGISIRSILISGEASTPVQVRQAYLEVTQARSDKATMIQTAQQQANALLGGSAGAAHRPLSDMIVAYELLGKAGDDDLAQTLRIELDESLHTLRLPGGDLSDKVNAYNQAMAEVISLETVDAQAQVDLIDAHRLQARADLAQSLSDIQSNPDFLRSGLRIEGQAAQTIKQAFGYQTEVIARIEEEYNRYAKFLPHYRERPTLLAADLWRSSQEKALADALIERVYVPMSLGQVRIRTDSDQQVRDRIAQDKMRRLREQAARLEAEENSRRR